MGTIISIWRKELRIYFTTWISYVFLAVFVVFGAYVFQAHLARFQQMSFQFMQMRASQYMEHLNLTDMVVGPLFAQLAVIMLFLIPVLTMRLMAEERSGRTMELLMTLPIRSYEIIIGKYLAALTLMWCAFVLMLIFPALLEVYGQSGSGDWAVDWSTVFTSYLGLFLFAASGIAIGLFWSSMTHSMLVSGFGSFITLIMLWVLGWKAYGDAGFWAELFGYLSIINHIEGFVRGMVKLSDLVYYLSLTLLGIFLSHRMLEAQRWQ